MEQRAGIDHELLLAQAGWVRGLAGSLVRDPLGAEDVAQETLLAALAAPPLRADHEPTLRAWLARVVTNLAHLSARRNGRRRNREQAAARPEQVPSVGETVARASQLRRVVDAALELDEPYRTTVLLRFLDGLGHDEIARRTGASPVAVRKRLSRGLERLRERFDAESGGDRDAWRTALFPLIQVPFGAPGPGALGAAAGPAAAGPWATAGALGAGLKTAAALWLALALVGVSALVCASLGGAPAGRAAEPGALASAPEPGPGLPLPGRRALPPAARPTPAWVPRTLERPSAPPAPEQLRRAPWTSDRRGPGLGGQVLGLDGRGLGGVQVVEAGAVQALAVSAPDGSFELDPGRLADPVGARLAAAAPDLATVRTAALETALEGGAAAGGQGSRALFVLAAPAVDLGGWVLDGLGRPVAGARLALEVPDAAFIDLWVPLDGTRAVPREAESDRSGRFELPALPTHPAFRLRVSAAGHGQVSLPLPGWTDRSWSIRLPEEPPAPGAIEGLVLLPDGRPALGARVRAGRFEVAVDSRGRYRLPVDPQRPAPTLVAELEGWRPAWETLSAGGGFGAAGPPPRPPPGAGGAGGGSSGSAGGAAGSGLHVLRIEGRLLSIPGLALTPAGLPAAGWEVLALDDGIDPRRPQRPPGGVAERTVSGPDGRFVLENLLERSYRILAVDPSSGLQAGPELVAAGGGVNLRAGAERPVLEGRISAPPRPDAAGRTGAPGLAGAVVRRVLPGADGPVPVGPAVRTESDGTFRLPGAAGAEGPLLVQHQSALAPSLVLGSQAAVAADAWFVYAGGPHEPAPDALAVLDGSGQLLTLHPPSGPTERLPLRGGRGPAVRVAETARALVLYRAGRELGRLPLELTAGELTPVHGWLPAQAAESRGNPVTPGAQRQP